jgi:hypothetical protein
MVNARVEGRKIRTCWEYLLRNTCSTVRGPVARRLANFMEIHVMIPGKVRRAFGAGTAPRRLSSAEVSYYLAGMIFKRAGALEQLHQQVVF